LPVDTRLPGAIVAGLVDAQAEGNAPRPGGAAAGGSGQCVERPPREPPTPLALAMVQHPLADAEEELDAAPATDDAQGRPLSSGPGTGCRRGSAAAAGCRLGDSGPRALASPAGQSADGSDRERAGGYCEHGVVSPLAGRSAARGLCRS